MTDKPRMPRKADDPQQSKRFIEAALEAEPKGEAEFERAFGKVSKGARTPMPEPKRRAKP